MKDREHLERIAAALDEAGLPEFPLAGCMEEGVRFLYNDRARLLDIVREVSRRLPSDAERWPCPICGRASPTAPPRRIEIRRSTGRTFTTSCDECTRWEGLRKVIVEYLKEKKALEE